MTVISSELINTAIETTVDIAMPNKNELAKLLTELDNLVKKYKEKCNKYIECK